MFSNVVSTIKKVSEPGVRQISSLATRQLPSLSFVSVRNLTSQVTSSIGSSTKKCSTDGGKCKNHGIVCSGAKCATHSGAHCAWLCPIAPVFQSLGSDYEQEAWTWWLLVPKFSVPCQSTTNIQILIFFKNKIDYPSMMSCLILQYYYTTDFKYFWFLVSNRKPHPPLQPHIPIEKWKLIINYFTKTYKKNHPFGKNLFLRLPEVAFAQMSI